MLNILLHTKTDKEKAKQFEKNFGVRIFVYEEKEQPSDEVLSRVDIYVGWKFEISPNKVPNLKWIHFFNAGIDTQIEHLKQFRERPIITNGKGAYDVQIGEHALALLLSLNRKINLFAINQADKVWERSGKLRVIKDSIVGIVGFGDIGSYTAKLIKSFGATVYAHKVSRIKKPKYVDKMFYMNDGLDTMLAECDTVMMFLPGTESTRNLFNRERMLKMKRGAVLINLGRGYTVDCDALAELVDSEYLGGAGLDVTEPEPLNPEHKLWNLENVIITPHVSWSSPDIKDKIFMIFAKNLKNYIEGKMMPNEFNFDRGY